MLFYCPESKFFYDDSEVIRDLLVNWSRQEVLKQVKQLINKAQMASVSKISEKGAS